MKGQAEIVVWGIGTPRTLRVHWVLAELGLQYRTEAIITRRAAMDDAEFLAVSPGKKIPALQHGDLSLTESGAITHFLMDTYSAAQWQAAEHAQINRWIFFALTELDATALYVIRRHEGLSDVYGAAPSAVSAAYAYVDRQLAVLQQALADNRTYLLAERFSEADIHMGSCLDWAMLIDIELPEQIAAYHLRLQERAAYQQANTANSTTQDV